MLKYKAVLFDLDGTINDSGPGIMKSVQYALGKMGYPPLPEETLRRFVGPSLQYSFRTFSGMSGEEAERAVALYRECYNNGEAYNLTVYDGMVQLLELLGESGVRCAVVTSKPQIMAGKVLAHSGLLGYFACVIGPDPKDGSNQKSVLIERALRELGLESRDVLMVGDTMYDIIGAAEAGCDSVGVTYGYGTEEELHAHNATYLADSAMEIGRIAGCGQEGTG